MAIKSPKQQQLQILQNNLEIHQETINSFLETSSNTLIRNEEGEQLLHSNHGLFNLQEQFLHLITALIPNTPSPSSHDSAAAAAASEEDEIETFLYYLITTYLYSDDELYEWLTFFRIDQRLLLAQNPTDHSSSSSSSRPTNPSPPIDWKERLLWSMNTKEGKCFKLGGMIPLTIIGHRNLLHFLADFSFCKCFYYFLEILQFEETIDAAGVYPHDLLRSKDFKESLFTLMNEIESSNAENKEVEVMKIKKFMERMLEQKKEEKEVKDMVRNYNQAALQREKERLERLQQQSLNAESKIPQAIQLADSCVEFGQCPFLKNYLPRQGPFTTTSQQPSIEVLVPNKVLLIHNFFSPPQCEEWMNSIQKVYEEGNYEAPNSLNRQGFQTKHTSIELVVHSLVYSIAKEYEGQLSYQETKTNYDAYHSFVISYDPTNVKEGSSSLPKHIDSSLWTANLCLEAIQSNNSVKFWTVNHSMTVRDKVEKEDKDKDIYQSHEIADPFQVGRTAVVPPDLVVSFQSGDLLLHHGDIYHETSGTMDPIHGKRTNVVIWYKQAKR